MIILTNCWFCGLQHLKPDRKKIDVTTGEIVTIEGNLFYVKDQYDNYLPVCTFCKELWDRDCELNG